MILMAKKSITRGRVESVFRKHGLSDKLNVVMDTTNYPLILDYVALGLGISVIVLGSENKVPPLHVRSVAKWLGSETTMLMRKKGTYKLPHMAGFRVIVRQTLARPDRE